MLGGKIGVVFYEYQKSEQCKLILGYSNQEKINEDIKWDGLKGYITNTNLSTSDIYQQYSELWQVERA